MVKAYFERLCPSCGKRVASTELLKYGVCARCSVSPKGFWERIQSLKEKVDLYKDLFELLVGKEMLPLQQSWLKRFLLGESFPLVASVGIGKTTFGLFATLIGIIEGKRALVVFPTKALVEQAHDIFVQWEKRLKKWKDGRLNKKEILKAVRNIVFYFSSKDKKIVESEKWDAIVATSQFLVRNHQKIAGKVEQVFVDDIDSMFKGSAIVYYVLLTLGYTPDEIKIARKEKIEAKGQLIISSATAKGVGNLLTNTVGIDIMTGRNWAFRNVKDFLAQLDMDEFFEKLAKLDGTGIVLFPSLEEVEKVYSSLSKKYKVLKSTDVSANLENVSRYKFLLGVANPRNPLVRGINLPDVVKWCAFWRPPHVKIPFSPSVERPFVLFWAARILARVIDIPSWWFDKLRQVQYVRDENKLKEDKWLNHIADKIRNYLLQQDIREKIASHVIYNPDEEVIVVPDTTTYLQATGRTSRLTAEGITAGVAVVNVRDELDKRLLDFLERRMKFFIEDFYFEKFDFRKAEKQLKDSKKMSVRPSVELVIVESPTKARTIASFFGKPAAKVFKGLTAWEVNAADVTFILTASRGHMLDLVEDEGIFGVVKEEAFVPVYKPIVKENEGEVIEDKKDVIDSLRQLAWEANTVLIATDPDTEGEKIAWDVYVNIAGFSEHVNRMKMHEITRREFEKAVLTEEKVDERLVEAQVLRRVADRWVGFGISRKLWEEFDANWLSAGRVQTPVLGWIIDRYERAKIKDLALVLASKAEGSRERLEVRIGEYKKREVGKLRNVEFEIVSREERETELLYPFNTSTLLTTASRILGWSADKVMQIAQTLFERGLITYHRTDSFRISDAGVGVARVYLKNNKLEDLIEPHRFSSEGAHEAIRPTKPVDYFELREIVKSGQISLSNDHLRLYDLIFRRFIASQMKREIAEFVKCVFKVKFEKRQFEVEKEFFTKPVRKTYSLYWNVSYFDVEGGFEAEVVYLPKIALFTQGTLVEEMRKRGLGRPSTYATIVATLFDRGYVKEYNRRIIPTELGIKVYRYLKEHYPEWIDEEFTLKLEREMEKVEKGEFDWADVSTALYSRIRAIVEVEREIEV